MKLNVQQVEILLANQGLSKAALAERCGISRQSLSTIIQRGSCEPRTAGKLAQGLGVAVTDVVAEPYKRKDDCNAIGNL